MSTETTVAAAEAVRVGDEIRFDSERRWWTVRDRDDRYIVATRQQAFAPKGDLLYTVIDLVGWLDHKYNGAGNGVVRSSLNALGGGWDIGPDGAGAEKIIPSLRSGESELSNRRVMDVRSIERREVAPAVTLEDAAAVMTMWWDATTWLPFVESEACDITGPGHQDAEAFARLVTAYDRHATGDPEVAATTAADVSHRWVILHANGEEWEVRTVPDGTPRAIPVTTIWGVR
ncbi:hypothetical protein [Cellulosimicrobium funkei]|uniref:hypothetical protein n=1 Tax=Cellulosimicrobium funkei TaxID=264251 RepID=UPI0036C1B6F1